MLFCQTLISDTCNYIYVHSNILFGNFFSTLQFVYSFVSRIDANVEETGLNVEAAHTEILKYFQSVTSNRWLMIKIFAVLIFFFVIFVVFMA